MSVDTELERLLEALDDAARRLDTRVPLLEEAEIELQSCEFISLDGYLGFGRTIKLNGEARMALKAAIEAEKVELKGAVDKARQEVLDRRIALAGV